MAHSRRRAAPHSERPASSPPGNWTCPAHNRRTGEYWTLWRRPHHPYGSRPAGLVAELLDLVEDFVTAGLPQWRALVVHAEHLGLDERPEEIEIGMRTQEPVGRAAVRQSRHFLEVIEFQRSIVGRPNLQCRSLDGEDAWHARR